MVKLAGERIKCKDYFLQKALLIFSFINHLYLKVNNNRFVGQFPKIHFHQTIVPLCFLITFIMFILLCLCFKGFWSLRSWFSVYYCVNMWSSHCRFKLSGSISFAAHNNVWRFIKTQFRNRYPLDETNDYNKSRILLFYVLISLDDSYF